MLKSRSYLPPGGFSFYQAEMDWNLPNAEYTGFEEAVTKIIQIRETNPRFKLPTDRATVSAELENFTERRLRDQFGSRADQFLIGAPAGGPPSNPLWRPVRTRPAQAEDAAGASKVTSGISTIISWLGNGLKPVDKTTATARALICSTCELNVPSEGILKAIRTAGDLLHMIAAAKSDLKLSTPYDDKLQSCSACGCVNGTKIWVPAAHIKSGMTPEVENALSAQCWIRPLLT